MNDIKNQNDIIIKFFILIKANKTKRNLLKQHKQSDNFFKISEF